MVKINKYLILMQLFVLTLIYQNIIQCAARIQTEQSATNLDLELIENARLGNREKVEQLIEQGANINTVDKDGNTALTWATRNGYKEIIELLIKAGVDVNAANIDGNTALTWAIRNGHKEIVELLIRAGVDINAANKYVELLIKAHANIDALGVYDSMTALIIATKLGHNEIVKLLLRAGADMEHKNVYGSNALELARESNKQEIVKMLEGEQSRRESVVKKFIENNKSWIKEILARKITESTSGLLITDISNIIAEYHSIEYTDIPIEYRLSTDIPIEYRLYNEPVRVRIIKFIS